MSVATEKVAKLEEALLTKDEALSRVAPFERCQEIFITGKTGFACSPEASEEFVLRNASKEYSFNKDGMEKLCRLAGIPATYVEKIPTDLLFPHLDYWFTQGDLAVKGLMRQGDEDKGGRPRVVGFMNRDAFYYPVSKMLEQVDKIHPDYLVEGMDDISWRNTSFGLVFPESEFLVETSDELKKGDNIFGGIKIVSSILGESPMKISAFFLTLACLNGMVSVDEIYTYNRRFGLDGVDAWVVDGISCATQAFQSEVEKIRRLTAVPITPLEIVPYVTHIFDQRGVSTHTRKAVLEQIVEKNPKNLYELMNAITATAHTIPKRSEVYSLQALGGYVASHAESCERCHRPLAS